MTNLLFLDLDYYHIKKTTFMLWMIGWEVGQTANFCFYSSIFAL